MEDNFEKSLSVIENSYKSIVTLDEEWRNLEEQLKCVRKVVYFETTVVSATAIVFKHFIKRGFYSEGRVKSLKKI